MSDDAKQIVKDADTDGDGRVSYENNVVFWKAFMVDPILFCRVCEGNASKAFVLSSDDLLVVS